MKYYNPNGYGYFFGSKVFFGKHGEEKLSFVPTYHTHKSNNDIYMDQIRKDLHTIKIMTAMKPHNRVAMLSKLIPNIIPLISPIFNIAYERQINMVDFNLETVDKNHFLQITIVVIHVLLFQLKTQ